MKKKQPTPAPRRKDLRPLARSQGLIIESLGDECLVYDTSNDEAHCLNPAASTIWKHCDGTRTIGELESLVIEPANRKAPALIEYCLAQLDRAHLLVKSESTTTFAAKTSRRELLRKLGIGLATAAVVLPAVTSILAPTPAAAASCLPNGAPCTGNAQCCSHSCQSTGESFVCRG